MLLSEGETSPSITRTVQRRGQRIDLKCRMATASLKTIPRALIMSLLMILRRGFYVYNVSRWRPGRPRPCVFVHNVEEAKRISFRHRSFPSERL